MEGLPAAMFVAGHAGSRGCFALSALVLTDIARLQRETRIKRGLPGSSARRDEQLSGTLL